MPKWFKTLLRWLKNAGNAAGPEVKAGKLVGKRRGRNGDPKKCRDIEFAARMDQRVTLRKGQVAEVD